MSNYLKVRTNVRREIDVINKYSSQGFNVLKRGWPDHLFYKYNDDGKLVVKFVEVKKKPKNSTNKFYGLKQVSDDHDKYFEEIGS